MPTLWQWIRLRTKRFFRLNLHAGSRCYGLPGRTLKRDARAAAGASGLAFVRRSPHVPTLRLAHLQNAVEATRLTGWVKWRARGRAAGFVAVMEQPVIGSPAHPRDSKRPVSATQPDTGRFLSPLPETSPACPRHARMPPRNGQGRRASVFWRTRMAHRGFWRELKRRNVLRAGVLYAGASWASAQGIAQLTPAIGLPDVAARWFLVAALIGFPFWVALAWFYEFTPQGLKRESEIAADAPSRHSAARKLDFAIIGVLVVAVMLLGSGYFIRRQAPAVAPALAS